MKKLSIILCSVLLLLASPASAADNASSCDNFTRKTIGRALAIFHDASQSEQQKRQSLSALFQEVVDMDWIAKYVLGRFWKTASADEQKQYLEYYRAYIATSYISKFKNEDGMDIDDIKLTSISLQQPGEYQAKTLIQSKGEDDVHVDYLLDESGGKCRIHDINIEGVSLLVTQSSEFQSLANSAGVKGVIAAMEKQLNN